ncbi:MAG: pilus assembly protein [Chloroflexi bacterium]|nr:pilus assembly protein [Chloroflexota bacterium]
MGRKIWRGMVRLQRDIVRRQRDTVGRPRDIVRLQRDRVGLRDEGQYLVLFALLFPLVIVLMGLVFDGGRLFQGYRRATLAANAAAQAGSQCIDVAHFQQTNQVRLDRGLALATANAYVLRNQGQGIEPAGLAADDHWVTVQVQARVPLAFMAVIGLPELTVGARGVARAHYGIDQVWQ